mgnify:CR=1 FL=1
MKQEEKVSFYSHFIGFILAVLGTAYLIYKTQDFAMNITIIIYGFSLITLFLASSLYHFSKENDEEITVWRKLDHIAIFIMIAGTYTPVSFIYLTGYWKWSIIIIQWTLVLGGLFFKFFYLNAPRYLYTMIYILMGWLGIIPIKIFIMSMSPIAIFLLLAGGISYTTGTIFYIVKKPRLNLKFGFHEIFHMFVLIGAFFHYLLIYIAAF